MATARPFLRRDVTRRSPGCARMSRPATSCWSRPRGGGARALADGLLDDATGEARKEDDAVRAILLAGGLALLISLLGTRVAITVLAERGLRPADPRRRPDHAPHQARHADDGRRGHHPRRRCSATSRPSCSPRRGRRASALLLLFLFVGLGLVGFLDDFIKISKQRSLGLRSKAKLVGQTVVALVFGVLALSRCSRTTAARPRRRDSISFIRDIDWLGAADRSS